MVLCKKGDDITPFDGTETRLIRARLKGKENAATEHLSGSVAFWYGFGSADPYR
jgi:hypothetical protein